MKKSIWDFGFVGVKVDLVKMFLAYRKNPFYLDNTNIQTDVVRSTRLVTPCRSSQVSFYPLRILFIIVCNKSGFLTGILPKYPIFEEHILGFQKYYVFSWQNNFMTEWWLLRTSFRIFHFFRSVPTGTGFSKKWVCSHTNTKNRKLNFRLWQVCVPGKRNQSKKQQHRNNLCPDTCV